jgi:hypothetical protein
MKKLLAGLLALAGISQSMAEESKQPVIMDPRQILLSIPTISDDIAAQDPADGAPADGALVFHEDDWTQLEFFTADRIDEVRRMLVELKTFEAAHRKGSAWTDLYIRKIERPVVLGNEPLKRLSSLLEKPAGAAPYLSSAGSVTGRVRDGFTFALGGNVWLYGYTQDGNVPVLGALVGSNPDDTKLVDAFQRLNREAKLIFVDWRQQLLLISVKDDGQIETWSP